MIQKQPPRERERHSGGNKENEKTLGRKQAQKNRHPHLSKTEFGCVFTNVHLGPFRFASAENSSSERNPVRLRPAAK